MAMRRRNNYLQSRGCSSPTVAVGGEAIRAVAKTPAEVSGTTRSLVQRFHEWVQSPDREGFFVCLLGNVQE